MRWGERLAVRPRLWGMIIGGAAALVLSGAAQAAHITAVHSIGLTVSDLEKSIEFYSRVLSFNKVGDTEVSGETYERVTGIFGMRAKIALMRLGEEDLILTEFLAPRGRVAPEDSRSNDRWFQHIAIVVSDMDKAYEWVHNRRAAFVSPNPQRLPDWNKDAGGIKAFYFRDPDGHPLELLQYPEGKGNPKWHRENRGEKLFLGIDHTAVVVASTEKSLHFYRDLLGLEVKGESENYGIEQERLNNVYGAHLKITSLRAHSGPGIEFLDYSVPAPCVNGQTPVSQTRFGGPAPCGRPYPADARPSDMIHWQTDLQTTDGQADAKDLENASIPFISSGTVTLSTDGKHTSKAFMVRDPDGHAVFITQK